MKKIVAAAALLGLLATGRSAQADIGTVDVVPAATLLVPYFEVDMANTSGINTLFSVNNASASAVLVHVVVWSDLSVPVLDFNIYLTGYDVQTVSMRDIMNGILPRTASDGQDPGDSGDPTDGISNQGLFSQDINFASCSGFLPPPANLGALYSTHLLRSLTGLSSSLLGGACAGLDFADNIARGYVTMDTVNACSLLFPGDPGYFTSFTTTQNVLFGDVFYVNSAQNFAQGDALVHIEASATDPLTTVPGNYTFYGRYVAWAATDRREALATNFAARFINGGVFNGGTDFLCWRDSKVDQSPFACPQVDGVRPSWYPLGDSTVIFDEQENPEVPESFPVSPQPANATNLICPAEANRTQIDGPSYPVTPSFGWVYLNLNQSNAAAGSNPPFNPFASQAWVSIVMEADGRFSVGFPAVPLDKASDPITGVPGSFPSTPKSEIPAN